MTVTLRPACSTAAGTNGVILHGFASDNDRMPTLHTQAETIAFCGRMIELGCVTVAELRGQVIGFPVLNGEEAQLLCLTGSARGQVIGRQLLETVKARRYGLSLFAFQDNHPALRFYECNGLSEVSHGDGSENDENLPDIKFVWKREGEDDG